MFVNIDKHKGVDGINMPIIFIAVTNARSGATSSLFTVVSI